jgi:polysaccharide export outer membrane protein
MSDVRLLSSIVRRRGNDPRGGVGVARVMLWGMLAATPMHSVPAAAAEYHLDVGDVIEISVARVPDLHRRVPVDLDGSVSFPLIGTVVVAGLTPPQVQARFQAALATRMRTGGGRDNDLVIDPDEVTVTVVEYRPIYVNGDVAKPGEYPYRARMTVHQVVALSGGYDIMRFRMNNPILDWADLKSDYESFWTEFAKEQAHVWRLRAELGDGSNADQNILDNVPLPQSTLAEIVKVETLHLSIRQSNHRREKAFLQRAVKQGYEQIAVLSEQQQKEEQGVQSDSEELQKVLELYGKGALPSPRVTDARRAVLLSSTRKLQTAAQLMQLKRQQEELQRQLERLDDQRRIDLLRDLQDADVRLGELRAKLQGIGDKLQYTALLRSQLVRGNSRSPLIVLIRKNEKGRERVVANEESELQPGDVVEISLQSVGAALMPAQ